MIIAVITLAFAFHLIPTPPDLGGTGEFQLGGYTVPADCGPADDEKNQCVRTAVDAPQFVPENDLVRPIAHISFVAPFDGRCGLAEAETINGKTQFALSKVATVVGGQRVFLRAVLLDQAEGAQIDWNVKDHYRIVVLCGSEDRANREPSAFYEVTTPPYGPT